MLGFGNTVFDALRTVEDRLDLASKRETWWCTTIRDHVRERLSECVNADVEVPYHDGINHCDLAFSFNDGRELFLEVKGAWPSYWANYRGRNHIGKYKTYLFYPLDSTVSADNKSAGLDLRRLATLCPPSVTHVGLLIIGSHHFTYDLARDLGRFSALGGLEAPAWQMMQTAFQNLRFDGYRYEIRLWTCPVTAVSSWWPTISHYYR